MKKKKIKSVKKKVNAPSGVAYVEFAAGWHEPGAAYIGEVAAYHPGFVVDPRQ